MGEYGYLQQYVLMQSINGTLFECFTSTSSNGLHLFIASIYYLNCNSGAI